jgi:hypothetical protein
VTRVEQHNDAGKGVRMLLARFLLLVAVISGVLALHVLTAEDHAVSSGQFAVSVTVQLTPAALDDQRTEAAVPDAGTGVGAVREPVGGAGSQWLAGCMLFLTVAASAALARLLLLVRRRRPADSTDRAEPGDRGYPGWVLPVLPPRLAAGVIRV